MKIIDCFTFYNEIDMLLYRLNVLSQFVDKFILVESTHTHAGNEKKLYYNDNKEVFAEFNDKIIHIIVDDFPFKFPNIDYSKNEQWHNEHYQRNAIKRGLAQLSLEADDIFILSDLDEIPNPTVLEKIKCGVYKLDNVYALEQDMYYYNLNTFMQKWYHAKIINYSYYLTKYLDIESIRSTSYCGVIPSGGWHLSYFGDSTFIKNKIQQFGHQEYNSIAFTDESLIETRMTHGLDLFGRQSNIKKIPIDMNKNLPPKYREFLGKYILF